MLTALRSRLVLTGAVSVIVVLSATALMARSAGARSSAATATAGTTSHTIAVNGHGTTRVAPDMATLTIGVVTKGSDAQGALQSNSSKMNGVISAIKGQGVPAKNIQTSDLSIWFDDQHGVYNVTHNLTVRIDVVSTIGAIIDTAVSAGANSSWGVQFGLKDEAAARSSALQGAIADARKRADAMAGALGVAVTGVDSASEGTVSGPIFYGGAKAGAPVAAGGTDVQTGELVVTADVNVVYTFG